MPTEDAILTRSSCDAPWRLMLGGAAFSAALAAAMIAEGQGMAAPSIALALALLAAGLGIHLKPRPTRICIAPREGCILVEESILPGLRRKRRIPYGEGDHISYERPARKPALFNRADPGGSLYLLRQGKKVRLYTNEESGAECSRVRDYLMEQLARRKSA